MWGKKAISNTAQMIFRCTKHNHLHTFNIKFSNNLNLLFV